MKETEFKSKRLTATTSDEKYVVKSWGRLWARFGQLERSGRPIILIFGDWSGYTSSQRHRITHVDHASLYGVKEDYRGTVQFTDNTTMNVWARTVTRKEILERRYERKQSYTSLIRTSIQSGQSYYKV